LFKQFTITTTIAYSLLLITGLELGSFSIYRVLVAYKISCSISFKPDHTNTVTNMFDLRFLKASSQTTHEQWTSTILQTLWVFYLLTLSPLIPLSLYTLPSRSNLQTPNVRNQKWWVRPGWRCTLNNSNLEQQVLKGLTFCQPDILNAESIVKGTFLTV